VRDKYLSPMADRVNLCGGAARSQHNADAACHRRINGVPRRLCRPRCWFRGRGILRWAVTTPTSARSPRSRFYEQGRFGRLVPTLPSAGDQLLY
jgi:hypothetical protein